MKKGLTLIELVIVLLIVGIAMSLFYSVLFLNWSSLEKQIGIVDLQMEADWVVNVISNDCKNSRQLEISRTGKDVTFYFPGANADSVTYSFTDAGRIQKRIGDNIAILSEKLDFDNSFFSKEGDSLVVEFYLKDRIFGRYLVLPVSTKVLPRNIR